MVNQQKEKYVLGKLIEIMNKVNDICIEIDSLGYYIADDNPSDWIGAIPDWCNSKNNNN